MKLPMNYFQIASAALLIAGALVSMAPVAAEEPASATDNKYLLKKQPKDAKEVLAIRGEAKDQQDIVVVGRIGGRANPWVKNAAAFSIVDRSLKPCNEIPGDTCKTPWDYCCEPNVAKSTLLVMFYDEKGQIMKKDAQALLGVDELDTVVVQGKAKRDKAGNVTIIASKVYVAPDKNKERTR